MSQARTVSRTEGSEAGQALARRGPSFGLWIALLPLLMLAGVRTAAADDVSDARQILTKWAEGAKARGTFVDWSTLVGFPIANDLNGAPLVAEAARLEENQRRGHGPYSMPVRRPLAPLSEEERQRLEKELVGLDACFGMLAAADAKPGFEPEISAEPSGFRVPLAGLERASTLQEFRGSLGDAEAVAAAEWLLSIATKWRVRTMFEGLSWDHHVFHALLVLKPFVSTPTAGVPPPSLDRVEALLDRARGAFLLSVRQRVMARQHSLYWYSLREVSGDDWREAPDRLWVRLSEGGANAPKGAVPRAPVSSRVEAAQESVRVLEEFAAALAAAGDPTKMRERLRSETGPSPFARAGSKTVGDFDYVLGLLTRIEATRACVRLARLRSGGVSPAAAAAEVAKGPYVDETAGGPVQVTAIDGAVEVRVSPPSSMWADDLRVQALAAWRIEFPAKAAK